MKLIKNIKSVVPIILLVFFSQCKKQNEWLEKKANNNDVILSTLDDYQALLDNESVLNMRYPGLGIVGADNYYTTFEIWQSLSTEVERNAYLWLPDVFAGSVVNDWDSPYRMVALCNIVLEGMHDKIVYNADLAKKQHLQGSALFYRAYAFYNLLQLFASPYSSETINGSTPGIPIKNSADVNERVGRSSLAASYKQVIDDLNSATKLLPEQAVHQTRPSGLASKALLARLYLAMADYDNALKYADEVLRIYDHLLDFNSMSQNAAFPIPGYPNNLEVLFYAETELYGITNFRTSRAIVDTVLYESYAASDLRKNIFFSNPDALGRVFFKGQYTGKANFFGGIAVNELYLIRAEASARLGDSENALVDLNSLRTKRWRKEAFEELKASDMENLLSSILEERRKELPFTGLLRWEDLRRLNRESRFQQTLKRNLNGSTYSLPPNDNRYVYPIPEREMRLNAMEQNPR